MKIYVDELPKSCEGCPCYHDGDGFEECKCNSTNHYVWYNKNGFFDCSQERPQDCPLQSLADYTKQVRKEVVQEIKDKAYQDSEFYDLENGGISERNTYLINEHILDQIQGE